MSDIETRRNLILLDGFAHAILLEHLLDMVPSERQLESYGDLQWIAELEDEDQEEFLDEYKKVLLLAWQGGDISDVEEFVEDWQASIDDVLPDVSVISFIDEFEFV